MEVFNSAVDEKTAVVASDYPYGFSLRCKARFWVETTAGKGQRFVKQTTNPRLPGEQWNKPKKSTYSAIVILHKNALGHVVASTLSDKASEAEVKRFVSTFGESNFNDGYRKSALKKLEQQRKHMTSKFVAKAADNGTLKF
jgi:hypothetical protein